MDLNLPLEESQVFFSIVIFSSKLLMVLQKKMGDIQQAFQKE
jgi:hypothetical protein